MYVQGFVFLCGLAAASAVISELPSYIPVCKKNDPKVEQCIINAIEVLRPKLKTGIEELDVPPLEPLYLEEMEIANGEDATKLKIYGRDINVYNPSTFVVKDFKFVRTNPKKPEFHVKLYIDQLRMEGKYDLSAKLVLLPINGNGGISVNASHAFLDAIIYGQIYKKNHKDFLRFYSADMDLSIDDLDVKLANLFNNEPTIALIANRIINDNKPEIIKQLTPVLTKAISKVIINIANKITGTVEYDTLFPDN